MKITIDHIQMDVPEGITVLKAAELAGISIPVLCFMEKSNCHSSCMVCLVKDLKTGKMFPSCAMLVQEGMIIQSHSPEIREMRREALELLLSDHAGDCEAPCRLSCPAFMDIPLMNRLIAGGNFREALWVVREEIAIPLILGYICPAPCEKACYRGMVDEPVSICMLKRYTARDFQELSRNLIIPVPEQGKKVAVIGSGPAGLSAAFYLRRMGFPVTIFDKNPLQGGTLRYDIPEEKLPRAALDAETETLRLMGTHIVNNSEITSEIFEKEIVTSFHAVILATGNPEKNPAGIFSLHPDSHGNYIDRKTGATSRPGIFGCGSLMREQKMAVRSSAQGKTAAREVALYLSPEQAIPRHFTFHSAISHIQLPEVKEYLQESADWNRLSPSGGWMPGFLETEAKKEASRCLHCDCRKPVTCRLRILCEEYEANRKRFTGPVRKPVVRIIRHNLLVYEPEKCIKCGHCIEITSREKEDLGLTFAGRGFDVRVAVPLGGEISEGIVRCAGACVDACPTGALSYKNVEDRFKI